MTTITAEQEKWNKKHIRWFRFADNDWEFPSYGIKLSPMDLSTDYMVYFSIYHQTNPGGDIECFMTGDVKWDGCFNVEWPETSVMWHFCDAQSFVSAFGIIIAMIYKLGAEMMPDNWQPMSGSKRELAEMTEHEYSRTKFESNLEVGKFYWVANQGPMKLKEPYKGEGHTVAFRNYNGHTYWASIEQVIQESSEQEAQAFVEELKKRGVLDENFKSNWDNTLEGGPV